MESNDEIATHNDPALQPDVSLVVQPDLNFLSTLQKAKYKVLRGPNRSISEIKRAKGVLPNTQHAEYFQRSFSSAEQRKPRLSWPRTHDGLGHNPLDFRRHLAGCRMSLLRDR